MLILLFDGAPSVPKETQMPESSISLIGAKPSILIAEAGQWDTLTPALERKPIWRRNDNSQITENMILELARDKSSDHNTKRIQSET